MSTHLSIFYIQSMGVSYTGDFLVGILLACDLSCNILGYEHQEYAVNMIFFPLSGFS